MAFLVARPAHVLETTTLSDNSDFVEWNESGIVRRGGRRSKADERDAKLARNRKKLSIHPKRSSLGGAREKERMASESGATGSTDASHSPDNSAVPVVDGQEQATSVLAVCATQSETTSAEETSQDTCPLDGTEKGSGAGLICCGCFYYCCWLLLLLLLFLLLLFLLLLLLFLLLLLLFY
jgi:hypothetical protein